ncbi:MAG: hypothetical protein U0V75_16695 [Ferruginibacter sp.]
MNKVLNTHNSILVLLAGILLASFPFLFFLNLALLALLTKIFLIICILDFIRKTTWRKKAGTILALIFLAEIASGIILLLVHTVSR